MKEHLLKVHDDIEPPFIEEIERIYKIEIKSCKDCIVKMLCLKPCELCEIEILNSFAWGVGV